LVLKASGGTCALPAKLRAELDLKLAAGASPAALAHEHGLKAHNLRYHRDRHLLYLLKPRPDGELPNLMGLRVLHIRTVKRRPASEVVGGGGE
jgi:hypothetical protein